MLTPLDVESCSQGCQFSSFQVWHLVTLAAATVIQPNQVKEAKTCLLFNHCRSGPPFGKHVLLFADDLNMPKLDTCGSQPPIELLRQFVDFGGLYDREKLFWKVSFSSFLIVSFHAAISRKKKRKKKFIWLLKSDHKAITKAYLRFFI